MRPFLPFMLPLLLTLAAPVCRAHEVSAAPAPHGALASLHKHGGIRISRSYAAPLPAGQHDRRGTQVSRILARAHQLIGTPYRFGGANLETGFDCSGLLVYLFRTEAGIDLPRTTGEMIRSDNAERILRARLKPGDFVFFNRNGRGNTSHVGLYIGNNQFIHAPRAGQSIREDSLDEAYWQRSYITARRFDG